jgi:hypothetical protein
MPAAISLTRLSMGVPNSKACTPLAVIQMSESLASMSLDAARKNPAKRLP